MTKKKFFIIAIPTFIIAYAYAKLIFSEVGIMQLHPEIPERDVIRAHRRMIRDLLTGKLSSDMIDTDDEIDQVFLTYVAALHL